VRLKSLTLKGFKSFPDRTHLDFGPGVSVVVGPNGSGKSNVTDAVLWAMGEQSPLAVRGQSMQDVIFGGGRGVQARSAAEVEIVLDNSDGTVDLPLSEISIVRRLDRAGEGGYRLNGARCRLTDVIEVLSDTGLGKEQHSVISQGRVESIVTSKPRDRRLLIEEAAGLGKHRKRRRRAQLKLERTQENLDRALDIEREARTRLRPLKRQAEAAELHERLERQLLEARWTLACEALRARGADLHGAESRVLSARERRATVESRLQAVVARRGEAERALTERSERHDALARRVYDARSARDRVGLRGEQTGASGRALAQRIERVEVELSALSETSSVDDDAAGTPESAAAENESGGRSGVRDGERSWEQAWEEIRRTLTDGVERASALADADARALAVGEAIAQAERLAQVAVERAVAQGLAELGSADRDPGGGRREAELVGERARRIERLHAQLAADLALAPVVERLGAVLARVGEAIEDGVVQRLQLQLTQDSAAGAQVAGELRACAQEEAEIQSELRAASEVVTEAEVAAQRLRDQAAEAELEVRTIAERLERPVPTIVVAATVATSEPTGEAAEDSAGEADEPGETGGEGTIGEADGADGTGADGTGVDGAGSAGEDERPQEDLQPLAPEEAQALEARVQRLTRRREQLGPVNPLAQEEYAQALAHVEELESRRADLETALRELRTVIRDTDRQIAETFEQTFAAAARNFEELAGDVFPGGSGRLRLVRDEHAPRGVLGGQSLGDGAPAGGADTADAAAVDGAAAEAAADAEAERDEHEREGEEELLGVEIEITPAGKSTKRLSLLSGGEKSMTALAFLFAVFLARPCPFYILDEVEAALDDLNLDRFLELLRRYSDRAQFIVITHQKRTMEAADWLYGVSMGGDGVSKVISRRLPPEAVEQAGEDVASAAVPVAEVA
jgi:chromosome segregation ATPase